MALKLYYLNLYFCFIIFVILILSLQIIYIMVDYQLLYLFLKNTMILIKKLFKIDIILIFFW